MRKEKAKWLRYHTKDDKGNSSAFANKKEAIEHAKKQNGWVLDLFTECGYGFKCVANFKTY